MKRDALFRHKVLEMLASGARIREIASTLGRTEGVIRQTIYLMRCDIGAKTNIELVVRYRENRLSGVFRGIRKWLRKS